MFEKSLEQHIEEIRAGIKAGKFANEASVAQGIVLRILHALSWPSYDTRIVWPEYSLEGKRVDYALCHHPGKPIVFIEVKLIGQSEGAERQLFEYAFHVGVPLAVLTDGQEWNFFLPGEQGNYGERRVYKLDIVERDIEECVFRLSSYLKYEAIVSGKAVEAAREDYRNVSRERQMRDKLPIAWAKLIEEEDDLLLELVADRVEQLCGYKPDPDMVARFLKDNVLLRTPSTSMQPPRPTAPLVTPAAVGGPVPKVGFVFNGQPYPARNARDMLVTVFEVLSKRDPTFLERFASLPKHGHTRRYLARSPKELYPGRADLAHESKQLSSGWWLGTNLSRASIERIIQMACEVAQIGYGRELSIYLGERQRGLARGGKP